MVRRQAWNDLKKLPAELIPDLFKLSGSYRSGGFRCRQCGFETTKKGFSGRQALRAHLKTHVLARRAWRRPLVRQALLVAIIAGIGIASNFEIFSVPVLWQPYPSWTVIWAVLGVSTVLMMLAVVIGADALLAPSKDKVNVLSVSRFLSTIAFALATALHVGVIKVDLPWWIYLWAGQFGVLSIWFAVAGGRANYLLKRRSRRSQRYDEMYVAKNDFSIFELTNWIRRRAKSVGR